MKRLMTILLVLGLMMVVAGPAQAVLVTANGSTVFYEDFETIIGTGTTGTEFDDQAADVGTWKVSSAAPTQIRGTSDTPSPFQGDQYLRWSDPSDAFGEFSTPATTGQALHFEAMFNPQPLVGGGGARIYLTQGTHPAWNIIGELYHAGGTMTSGFGAATLGSVTIGTWHKIEMNYVVGASTYDAALDGAWTTGIGILAGVPTSATGIMLTDAGTAHNGLIDATPEPATLGVLLLGGLMFIVRRR